MSASRRQFLKTASRTLMSLPLWGIVRPFVESDVDHSNGDIDKLMIYQNKSLLPKETTEKRLTFYNTHTGEWVKKCLFWQDGGFNTSALASINYLFRDHRSHCVKTIDPQLIILLHRMIELLGTNRPIHLVSGFRSKKTNDRLRLEGHGVARNSFHTKGKAADIFVEGRPLSYIHRAVIRLRKGGVGRYSTFVHVDTGRFRHWENSC